MSIFSWFLKIEYLCNVEVENILTNMRDINPSFLKTFFAKFWFLHGRHCTESLHNVVMRENLLDIALVFAKH